MPRVRSRLPSSTSSMLRDPSSSNRSNADLSSLSCCLVRLFTASACRARSSAMLLLTVAGESRPTPDSNMAARLTCDAIMVSVFSTCMEFSSCISTSVSLITPGALSCSTDVTNTTSGSRVTGAQNKIRTSGTRAEIACQRAIVEMSSRAAHRMTRVMRMELMKRSMRRKKMRIEGPLAPPMKRSSILLLPALNLRFSYGNCASMISRSGVEKFSMASWTADLIAALSSFPP